jgi:hypothetical protein
VKKKKKFYNIDTWTVDESRRFVVDAKREPVVKAEEDLFGRVDGAAHQLELEARVFVVADDAENDELGSDRKREGDHGQLAVISGIANGQVEVGEVDDVVVLLALLVEEPVGNVKNFFYLSLTLVLKSYGVMSVVSFFRQV